MKRRFHIGVDLGKARDYTAAAVLEVVKGDNKDLFLLKHLDRFDLGMSYEAIANRLRDLYRTVETLGEAWMVADKTGVGGPVMDMLRARDIRRLVGVTITGGTDFHKKAFGDYTVPKRDLVSNMRIALETGVLKFSDQLPHAKTLERELQGFKMKISQTGYDAYEHAKGGDHDDLVLAIAMPCWYVRTIRRTTWLVL